MVQEIVYTENVYSLNLLLRFKTLLKNLVIWIPNYKIKVTFVCKYYTSI